MLVDGVGLMYSHSLYYISILNYFGEHSPCSLLLSVEGEPTTLVAGEDKYKEEQEVEEVEVEPKEVVDDDDGNGGGLYF